NGGITWTPLFDKQPIASIGDIAVVPNNPNVVYVGTGESNVRNSVSFGNGVYKTMDGGKSWIHLGLEDTHHISRIVIDPLNPRIVFVGALGHAFGPNSERGVYRSADGGNTWKLALYIDARHGVADMDINPKNPNIVYAAFWNFERKPWTFVSGGENGGLYKSIDGGLNWRKITRGLPKLAGRMGVKVAPSNPDIVYLIAESKEGTLFRSEDGGDSFNLVSKDVEIVSRGFYYTDIRVDPRDENRIYAVSSRLWVSIDGGRSFKQISRSTHVDYHSLWIDPSNPNRMWQGQDGGICVSYDRGEHWDYVNNFSVAQFYQIYADDRQPFYYVGGGLQDNGCWYGPSRNREPFGILNDEWKMVSFGDGFFMVAHPDNPELFLSESQGGNILRTNMRTREQQNVSPQARRADGAPVSTLEYRFNWNTPIISSPHDKNTVYVGSNVVFKSTDFGSTWKVISPDLTTNDPLKQRTAGGPPWPENTTAEYHCTIISLAESPVQPGVLWAGTDDGNLFVSMDGGDNWSNLIKQIPGLPENSPVSHIEPSSTSAGMAYCAFDRHMLDDYKPYIYKTSDFGRTWEKITENLPDKNYVWVVREDPKNTRVVYAGTELGLYASFERGNNWVKIHGKNLPTAAVHDILIHPRRNDLILATHGRGIWILDGISFIQELTPEMLQQKAALFPIRNALRFSTKPTTYGIGDRVFRGTNPPYGALITYYLNENMEEEKGLRLDILNASREVIRTIDFLPGHPGLNRVAWDLRTEPPRQRRETEIEPDFFFRGPLGHQVLPGMYTARLQVGEQSFEKPLEVKLDPLLDISGEDLEIQERYCRQLIDMMSHVNDALKRLDLLKEQLEDRLELVKAQQLESTSVAADAIQQTLEFVNSCLDNMVRPEGVPFWSDGPRLSERLSSLFSAIDGVNAVPTQQQIEYFNQLQLEFNASIDKLNLFISQDAGNLNQKLKEAGIPQIYIPSLIDIQIR
ncbi:MAG: hypothetical protein JW755_04215, partial [Candidatus Aminicenantes bacterium]|nr:hypothetical protein [Candidatus Aminicenantes bacterium]